MDLWPPQLLYTRPARDEFAVAVVVPVVFGVVNGLVLGWSEGVYLLLQVVAIAGGYLGGMEHDVPLEGVYRGLLGGLLFGTAILVTNGITGDDPKAGLPDPETLLVVITAVAGSLLGWLGARRRAGWAAAQPRGEV